MQLSVIIVNYNVKFFLEQCLASVIKACRNIDAEIIVVDNNSTDGSHKFFNNRFAEVQFTWLKENKGFAAANNMALQRTQGEMILFLNPDTILPEDCLEKCIEFFNSKDDIGTLGVRMIDGSGQYLPESKRGFPNLLTSFFKLSGFTALFPHSGLFSKYYLGHLPENQNHEVEVLSGAFIMTEKKTLDKIGSFDERFFMYGEDIDLSYRVQKAGFKNYYFADCTIIHFKGESTQKETVQYVRNFYGAMLLFVKKHYNKVRSALYGAMIKVVMTMKMASASVKKFSAKNATSFKNDLVEAKAFIISNEKEFQSIQAGLDKYFSQTERTGISKDILLPGVVIILCEPQLSFKEMIEMIQRYPCQFLIHANATLGIVGSTDKKSQGRIIAIQ